MGGAQVRAVGCIRRWRGSSAGQRNRSAANALGEHVQAQRDQVDVAGAFTVAAEQVPSMRSAPAMYPVPGRRHTGAAVIVGVQEIRMDSRPFRLRSIHSMESA